MCVGVERVDVISSFFVKHAPISHYVCCACQGLPAICASAAPQRAPALVQGCLLLPSSHFDRAKMKADFVARITDDLAKVGKDQNVQDDHVVSELTPQAKLLAEMAKEATAKPVEGDWDIKPHPLLAAAAPSREQFDAEGTAPVVIMRNPIAGKQVSRIRQM